MLNHYMIERNFSIKYANGIYLPHNAGKKKETELKRLAKKIGLDKK